LVLRSRSAILRQFEVSYMMQTWGGWKRFPDVKGGDVVEAPAGPGVYEVRHMLTGRVVAFGHSGDVAHTIAGLKFDGDGGPIANFFRKPPLVSRIADLEYRTCAAPRPRPPRNGCSACGRPPGAGEWTWAGPPAIRADRRMIPKSGIRFSDKIMRK
jgi:hypothetical protein